MNVVVVESGNMTQVAESNSSVEITELAPIVSVDEASEVVEVREAVSSITIVEVDHTVTVQDSGSIVVEVISQGPKGDPASTESGAVFIYTDGAVSRINYDSGNYKLLTYFDGRLSQIDYVQSNKIIRKDFTYNLDGSLSYITQAEIFT